jgi:ABC-type uncharacterized transport system substrate-binding protein
MFICGIGLALLFGTRGGRAQQTQTVYRIGLVEAGTASANQLFVDAFMAGLRELGYLPDKNIVVDVRWAEGTTEGFRGNLAELIQLRLDVLVVSSVVGALEAKRATSSIPVVFIGVGDPVASGLVRDWPSPEAISPDWRAPLARALSARLSRCSPRSRLAGRAWRSCGIQNLPSRA